MRRILTAVAALILASVAGGAWMAAAHASQSSPVSPAASKYKPAQIVRTADAVYPINSVAFGTVVLEVHLDATGEIETVRVARDIASLTPQALQAIKGWRFTPATLRGKPVPSTVPVAFIFVRPDLYPRYGGGQPKH